MSEIARVLVDLRVSSFHETEAVSPEPGQPSFLNAAAVGDTTLSAVDLLDALLRIEQGLGRERPYVGAPRTIDLDLILYGQDVVEEPGLCVPHPRFRGRRFVLGPLAEIAPEWIDPVTGQTVTQLLGRL